MHAVIGFHGHNLFYSLVQDELKGVFYLPVYLIPSLSS